MSSGRVCLDPEVYKWLSTINVIQQTNKHRSLPNGKYEIDPDNSKMLENGFKFAEIVRGLGRLLNEGGSTPTNLPMLNSLKNQNTSAARLYNWNIISDALKKIGLTMDPDIKSLLVVGDPQMINEFLKDVYDTAQNKLDKLSSISSQHSSRTNKFENNLKQYAMGMSEEGKKKSSSPGIEILKSQIIILSEVNLRNFDTNKELSESKNLLDFLLTSLSKNLSLKPKQAAVLLTNGNKYLAHVLVKGMKSNYQPLSNWMQDLYMNLKHLLTLLQKDENTIHIFLHTLKPGFISKDLEISSWTCRLVSKLAFELANIDLLAVVWNWFCQENGGLQSCLLALKRHKEEIRDNIVTVLVQIGRFNISELITVQMRIFLPDVRDYINAVHLMLKPFSDSKSSKEELVNNGVVDYWIESALTAGDMENKSSSLDLKISAIGFICDLWITYPTLFEEKHNPSVTVINLLKKGIRDKSCALKFSCFSFLFKLLENFAQERHPYAPILYKTLTFTLIETHSDPSLRHFLLENFQNIFETFPNIPIAILLEPLIKQIQVSEGKTYNMNVFDVKFLDACSGHPKLTVKVGIQLLDLVAKIYTSNLIFAKSLQPTIERLFSKFIEEEAFQEYIIKLLKIGMAMFMSSDKKKKPLPKISAFDNLMGTRHLSAENEIEIVNAQKRSLIIEMIHAALVIGCVAVNNQVKPLLVQTFTKLRKHYNGTPNKALLKLLKLFGEDTEAIVQEVEAKLELEKNLNDETTTINTGMDDANTSINTILKPKFDEESVQIGSPRESNSFRIHKVVGKTPNKQGGSRPSSQNDFFLNEMEMQEAKTKKKLFEMLDESELNFQEKKRPEKKSAKAAANGVRAISMPKKTAADIKAVEEIEKIRLKKIEDQLKKQIEEEEKKLKEMAVKKKLRAQIEKRNIELGVVSRNPQKEVSEQLLNNTEKPVNGENGQRRAERELIDFEKEEDRERESLAVVMRRYNRAVKFLFSKYSNSTNQARKKELFGELKEKFDVISHSDLLSLIKDHELTNSIKKDEVSVIIKQVNQRYFGKNDSNTLDYEGFIKVLPQIAYVIYSKKPNDLRYAPSGVWMQAFFKSLEGVTRRKGDMATLSVYEESEGGKENELVVMLNTQLKLEPEKPIPDNFKKVVEKNVEFSYRIPDSLRSQLEEPVQVCSELVDDLISKILGTHFLEPKMEVSYMTKVKPKNAIIGKSEAPRQKQNPGHVNELKKIKNVGNQNVEAAEVVTKQEGERPVENEEIEAKSDDGDAGKGKEIMKPKIRSKSPAPQVIKNKIFEEKQRQEEEEKRRREEQEKKWTLRKQKVEEELRERKEKKKEEEQQKLEKEKQDKEKKDDEERKIQEKLKKEQDLKKQLLKDYKGKQEEEKKKNLEKQLEDQKKKEEEKKKEKDEFMKKQNEKIKKTLEDKKISREEEEKKKKEKEKQEKEKEEVRKKKMDQVLEKEKEKRELEKQNREKISKLFLSEAFQNNFKKFEKQLTVLYHNYSEGATTTLGSATHEMQFKPFMSILSDFFVTPSLISVEEAQLIFKSLTKLKPLVDNMPIGLNYEEFLQALLRIAIKAKPQLDIIQEKNQSKQNSQKEVAQKESSSKQANKRRQSDEIDEEEKIENEGDIQEDNMNHASIDGEPELNPNTEDTYKQLDDMSPKSLEVLLLYFELPEDKNSLLLKINEKKSKNSKAMAPRHKKKILSSKINEREDSRDRSANTREVVDKDKPKPKKKGENSENINNI